METAEIRSHEALQIQVPLEIVTGIIVCYGRFRRTAAFRTEYSMDSLSKGLQIVLKSLDFHVI